MIFAKTDKNLTDEIQFLSLFLSSAIIIAVQLVLLLVISLSMLSTLKVKAETAADEAVAFLREPLYTLDDIQAKRIGEALLTSGRISEILIFSNATGELLSASTGHTSTIIPVSTREIMYKDIYLGSVSLQYSDRELTDMIYLLLTAMILVMIAMVFANFIAHKKIIQNRIMAPLRSITIGLHEIGRGKEETTIPQTAYSDINILVNIINDMSNKIQRKKIELVEVNNSLEQRVNERTLQLSKSLENLHQAQDKLIETGKLSALGLLSAGMAHELNTPLGAIISSNQNLISILEKREFTLPQFFKDLDNAEITLYLEILETAIKKGKLLDIDHIDRLKKRELEAELEWKEIPNSSKIAEILTELGISELKQDLLFLLKTQQNEVILSQIHDVFIARKMAEVVQIAAQKAATVITDLRSYLSADPEQIEEHVNVTNTIDHILTLMNNMLKHGIEIKKEYTPVFISGSADKLGQVWMNIIRNAAESMNFNGTLTIKSENREDRVIITFEDNGSGISEDIKDKIFSPFFSTKNAKEGMGLGLGICQRIIENHGGFIDFESKSGVTRFIINLPAAKD